MEEELKKLLEENLALTRQVLEGVNKIRRHIAWQRVMSIIYLGLIVAPIIFAAIYLPTLLQTYIGQYQEILQGIK